MLLALMAFSNILALGYSQMLGATQYCTDLQPQFNLSISKLTGTWFGAEMITHRDRTTGEKSERDCIYVVISQITQEVNFSFILIPI